MVRGVEDPYPHKVPSLSRNTSTPAGAGVCPPRSLFLKCTDFVVL